MIILRPIGGLCNRMRAIDSFLSICNLYNRDLTVLWVEDFSLNCPFEEIFEVPKTVNFKFEVINCPEGFPEQYLQNKQILLDNEDTNLSIKLRFINQIKPLLKWVGLNKRQREIKNKLKTINKTEVLSNDFFTSFYQLENTTVNKMDEKFIKKVMPNYKTTLENTDLTYVSSCYRIYPIENRYTLFQIKEKIQIRVMEITKKFVNTIGLHIRRSDHQTAKAHSPLEKFIDIINNELILNLESNFFLSTDDGDTKDFLVKEFGDKIITNPINSYDRNNKNAILDAVVDLYCLSETKKIYGSHHSSFSQTAAHIGGILEETVKYKS